MKRPGDKQRGDDKQGRDDKRRPKLAIRTDMLRQHRDAAQIDRVWERLERSVGGGQPLQPGRRRWPAIAAAIAAGFVIGISSAGWLNPPSPIAKVELEAATDDSPAVPTLFAAGATPRSYPLPGGGSLRLDPGSIVDTVASRDGQTTLRLLQGAALLSPANVGTTTGTLALMIGEARVVAAGGRVEVRKDGDRAYLKVLEGSAAVSPPEGMRGAKKLLLGPGEEKTVATRVLTARVAPSELASRPGPQEVASPEESEQEEAIVDPAETPAAASAPPEWVVACKQAGDDRRAAELFRASGLSHLDVNDPQLLHCISSGSEYLKDTGAAIAAAERIVNTFAHQPGQDVRVATAARALARLYSKRGLDGDLQKARDAAQLASSLEKLVPTAAALCHKIQSAAAAKEYGAVVDLSERYQARYPNGDCTDQIRAILAAVEEAKRALETAEGDEKTAKDKGKPDATGDDPYADEDATP